MRTSSKKPDGQADSFIGSSKIPFPRRRRLARVPGRRNSLGNRTAWDRPFMKSDVVRSGIRHLRIVPSKPSPRLSSCQLLCEDVADYGGVGSMRICLGMRNPPDAIRNMSINHDRPLWLSDADGSRVAQAGQSQGGHDGEEEVFHGFNRVNVQTDGQRCHDGYGLSRVSSPSPVGDRRPCLVSLWSSSTAIHSSITTSNTRPVGASILTLA